MRLNKTKTKICEFCNEEFNARDDAKTCSNKCRMAWSRKRGKYTTSTQTCIICDEEFKSKQGAKTCGSKCRKRLSRSDVEIISIPIPLIVDESKDRATWLYKVFNYAGNLLYVGITFNPTQRMKEHRRLSIWWEDKDKMIWQRFETRQEAERAEDWSIKNDYPVFNIAGKI